MQRVARVLGYDPETGVADVVVSYVFRLEELPWIAPIVARIRMLDRSYGQKLRMAIATSPGFRALLNALGLDPRRLVSVSENTLVFVKGVGGRVAVDLDRIEDLLTEVREDLDARIEQLRQEIEELSQAKGILGGLSAKIKLPRLRAELAKLETLRRALENVDRVLGEVEAIRRIVDEWLGRRRQLEEELNSAISNLEEDAFQRARRVIKLPGGSLELVGARVVTDRSGGIALVLDYGGRIRLGRGVSVPALSIWGAPRYYGY